MKLLTVVIPVYNAENFLKTSLESVINSSYENLEIICINDASTDNSLNILNYYGKKDKRITIINKLKNEGPMEAREEAYKICNGEYITNIDSDDYIEKDTFEKAIKIFEEDKDVEISLYDSYYKKNAKEEKINKFLNGKFLSGIEAFIYSLDWKIGGLGIFKKELFLNSINVPRVYNGDEIITRQVFLNSKKIYLSKGKYIYRINEESLTKSKSFNSRRIETLISNSYILNLAKEKDITGREIEEYKISSLVASINLIRSILKNKKELSYKDKEKIKKIVEKWEKEIDYKSGIKFFIELSQIKKVVKLLICVPFLYFYTLKIKKI